MSYLVSIQQRTAVFFHDTTRHEQAQEHLWHGCQQAVEAPAMLQLGSPWALVQMQGKVQPLCTHMGTLITEELFRTLHT